MKQFSLEEFIKNPNRKVATKDGHSVRIICTDAKGNYPVIALVLNDDNDYEDIEFYTPDGECSDISEGKIDLFFAPVKREGYVNLYRHEDGLITGRVYDTEEEAKDKYNPRYVSTVKVQWEE